MTETVACVIYYLSLRPAKVKIKPCAVTASFSLFERTCL